MGSYTHLRFLLLLLLWYKVLLTRRTPMIWLANSSSISAPMKMMRSRVSRLYISTHSPPRLPGILYATFGTPMGIIVRLPAPDLPLVKQLSRERQNDEKGAWSLLLPGCALCCSADRRRKREPFHRTRQYKNEKEA